MWQDTLNLLNIRHHMSTPYHPQSNGLIECWHRTLKQALVAKGGDWEENLPWALLYNRCAIKPDLRYGPAGLTFGFLPVLPVALWPRKEFLLDPDAFGNTFTRMDFPVADVPRHHVVKRQEQLLNFDNCTHVFVPKDGVVPSLRPKYAGPFEIIERYPRAMKLDIKNRTDVISIERLKPVTFWKDNYVHAPCEDHIHPHPIHHHPCPTISSNAANE